MNVPLLFCMLTIFTVFGNNLANVIRVTPCGYALNSESKFIVTKYHLKQTLNKTWTIVSPLISSNNNYNFPESWIPTGQNLSSLDQGLAGSSKIVGYLLPRAYDCLRVFSVALDIYLININMFREDKEGDAEERVQELVKLNAQMICEFDFIMRKHEGLMLNEYKKYTVPNVWLENSRSIEKTFRMMKLQEIVYKYFDFLKEFNILLKNWSIE